MTHSSLPEEGEGDAGVEPGDGDPWDEPGDCMVVAVTLIGLLEEGEELAGPVELSSSPELAFWTIIKPPGLEDGIPVVGTCTAAIPVSVEEEELEEVGFATEEPAASGAVVDTAIEAAYGRL